MPINFTQTSVFAIIFSGAYIAVSIGLFLISVNPELHNFDVIRNYLSNYQWVLISFFLGVSYFFGIAIRSLPTSLTENITFNAKERFPYNSILKKTIMELPGSKDILDSLDINLDNFEITDEKFKYMKSFICSRNISLFSYTQSFENKVRFWVGLYWSSFFSLCINVLTIIFSDLSLKLPVSLLLFSVVVFCLANFRFQPVRIGEAVVTTVSYGVVVNEPDVPEFTIKEKNNDAIIIDTN